MRFRPMAGKNKCRMCIYRRSSNAKELLGSFKAQGSNAYFFVIAGVQFYCHKQCEE